MYEYVKCILFETNHLLAFYGFLHLYFIYEHPFPPPHTITGEYISLSHEFLTSNNIKIEEIPKQETDAANAPPVKHPNVASNIGFSSKTYYLTFLHRKQAKSSLTHKKSPCKRPFREDVLKSVDGERRVVITILM